MYVKFITLFCVTWVIYVAIPKHQDYYYRMEVLQNVESNELDIKIARCLQVVDTGLSTLTNRDLVAVSEFSDLLLDVRHALVASV